MTHEYTLLVGGTVIPGAAEPDATAIAWAEGTVLAIGSDDEVRAISRGDSAMLELHGATVIPLAPGGAAAWPTAATLEVGGPADLAVLRSDPRHTTELRVQALVRAGHVVAGALPAAPSGR